MALLLEIPEPTRANFWRAFFNNKFDALSTQVTNIEVSYSKRELVLQIEQSIDGREHKAVAQFVKTPLQIDIEALSTDGTPLYNLSFSGLKMLDHHYTFDYSVSCSLKHYIKIEYSRFDTTIPTKINLTK